MLQRNTPIFTQEYSTIDITLTSEEKSIIESELHYYLDIINCIVVEENYFRCSIKTKFYIGLLKISETLDIVIQPKIPSADFLAMLAFIDTKYVLIYQDLVGKLDKDQDFLFLFLESFLKKVEELLIGNRRKDYSRYASIEKIPKGKINICKSIKLQKNIIPTFWCEIFLHSLDTPHNQVIKYTLDYIRNSVPNELLPLYRRIMHYLNETSLEPWSLAEIERLNYDRLNFGYKDILTLCTMILEDFSIKFQLGQKKFFAFVLNTWNVYETFLRNIFERFQKIYKVNAYQIQNLSQRVDWDDISQQGRPDIILYSDNGFQIIIDAKYKTSFSQHDENQIYRYIGERDTRIGYLIYPKSEGLQNERTTSARLGTKDIIIHYKLIDLSEINKEDYLREFVTSIVDEICLRM